MKDRRSSIDLEALARFRAEVSFENFNSSYTLPADDALDELSAENVAIARTAAACAKYEGFAAQNQIRAIQIRQKQRDDARTLKVKLIYDKKRKYEINIRLEASRKRYQESVSATHEQRVQRICGDVEAEKENRKRYVLPTFIESFYRHIEENYFPELPDDAHSLIERVWNRRASQDEVFCEDFGMKITRKDLLKLCGLDWLNDEVITFYLNLIARRSETSSDMPKTYNFNTYFLDSLKNRGYASVKRWTRNVDIFSYDILLIPVHLGNHWCLATVDFKAREINYFDSLGGVNHECLELLRDYLKEEHQDKKKSAFDCSGWAIECKAAIPKQMNGSDCGVFTCVFAEFSSRRSELNFDQRVMADFRKRMVYEICRKELMI